MARRDLYDAADMGDQVATLEHLAELRSDINQALQQISQQLQTRPNPRAAASSASESPLMAQLFTLQAEMREQARAENERLRAELRDMSEQRDDPLDELERAQRIVELLPHEKDDSKEMIMGALGMLAEVMARGNDSETTPAPSPAATAGNEGYVPEQRTRPEEPADPAQDLGNGSAIVTDFGVVLVED